MDSRYYDYKLKFFKCSAPIPACGSGPDHLCSDGKCYSQSGCPMGTFLVSNNTCTCSSACNGTITSYLQVNSNKFFNLKFF